MLRLHSIALPLESHPPMTPRRRTWADESEDPANDSFGNESEDNAVPKAMVPDVRECAELRLLAVGSGGVKDNAFPQP